MTGERDFIAALRAFATHPAARGLSDDAAVLSLPAGEIVVTHDILAEGIHYLPATAAPDVATKLVAVNLSDLAAKGARPLAALLGYTLGESDWDTAFAAALGDALARHDLPLIGGDTVRLAAMAPRVLGLTVLGAAPTGGAPARSGAQAGDALWFTGTIGDAGAGLALCRVGATEPADLVDAYLRPRPLLAEGQALAAQVTAMMDVSDGLLIDAARMAQASGLAVGIAIDALPLSDALIAHAGDDREARLAAATAGDDYQLLFALPAGESPCVAATRIGAFADGEGLALSWRGAPLALPDSLGFVH
jgi:thiamine-monophosphate kinase